jgi:hypothetical protein
MRGALQPMEGDNNPSLLICGRRAGHARPRILCDSGRAGEGGGGGACEKNPRSSCRRPRLDPRIPSSEIIATQPAIALHLASASPFRRVCPFPVGCQLFPAPADPYHIARTLPLWLAVVEARLSGRYAFAITLAHSLWHSCRW